PMGAVGRTTRGPDGAGVLRGRTAVAGVAGGTAADKASALVRWLKPRGASATLATTPAAAGFVTPLTFPTLSATPAGRDPAGGQRGPRPWRRAACGARSGTCRRRRPRRR